MGTAEMGGSYDMSGVVRVRQLQPVSIINVVPETLGFLLGG